jgi:hypothetical protein
VRVARGFRSIRLARAIACREQELLAHSRREKRRLEPEVGSVHDHSEAKHIVAKSSRTLDATDAEEYAGAVDLGGRDVWCHQADPFPATRRYDRAGYSVSPLDRASFSARSKMSSSS